MSIIPLGQGTTVFISKDLRERLQSIRIYPRETYEEIIRRLLDGKTTT